MQMKARVDALYRPPFYFDGITYIQDADNRMVAYYGDKEYDENDNRTGFGQLTARGWGRIKYLRDPEALFDATEARIHSIVPADATPQEAVDALNTHWGPGLNDPSTVLEERYTLEQELAETQAERRKARRRRRRHKGAGM